MKPNNNKNARNSKSPRKTNTKGRNYKKDSEEEEVTSKSRSASNDISWYYTNPQSLIDVGSLPFAKRMSGTIEVEPIGGGFAEGANPYVFKYGGVARIGLTPSIGTLSYGPAEAPINTAMRNIYSYVRHVNSGSKNYDAPDLMLYFLAIDSAMMYWSWMVRLYGIIRNFNYVNSFSPYTLAHAMKINHPSALTAQLSQLRTFINFYADMLNSMAVPTVMPYIRRHLWLYQNVFLDRASGKGQMYLFDPDRYYTYNEYSGAGQLDPIEFDRITSESGEEIMDTIRTFGLNLIEKLRQSEDIGIMSGDILKAYGAQNIYSFLPIPEEYRVVPVYDETVLVQIHNATLVPITSNTDLTIKQDITTGNLYTGAIAAGALQNTILNVPYEHPTPEDVMYATRLVALSKSYDDLNNPITFTSGSEFMTSLTVFTSPLVNYDPSTTFKVAFQIWSLSPLDYDNGAEVYRLVKMYNYASNFRYFPIIWTSMFSNQSGAHEFSVIHADIENYTNMDYETLNNLHTIAFNGMFGVPYNLVRG